MTQLSGQEASALAYIARYPKTRQARELAETLEGAAQEIARALLDKAAKEVSPSNRATAKAIRAWAASA